MILLAKFDFTDVCIPRCRLRDLQRGPRPFTFGLWDSISGSTTPPPLTFVSFVSLISFSFLFYLTFSPFLTLSLFLVLLSFLFCLISSFFSFLSFVLFLFLPLFPSCFFLRPSCFFRLLSFALSFLFFFFSLLFSFLFFSFIFSFFSFLGFFSFSFFCFCYLLSFFSLLCFVLFCLFFFVAFFFLCLFFLFFLSCIVLFFVLYLFCFFVLFFVFFFCFFFAVVFSFVLLVIDTYGYVHGKYFNCGPALGLGSVSALALTDSLLIDIFRNLSMASSSICIRCAHTDSCYVVLSLGHYEVMRSQWRTWRHHGPYHRGLFSRPAFKWHRDLLFLSPSGDPWIFLPFLIALCT